MRRVAHNLNAAGKWKGQVVHKVKGRSRASTLTEKLAMKELLDQHLKPIGNKGYFKYAKGWDDARIASETSPLLTTYHAKHVRVQLFGNIKREAKPRVGSPKLKARFDLLETRFVKLLGVLNLSAEQQAIVMGIPDEPEDAVSTDTPEGGN